MSAVTTTTATSAGSAKLNFHSEFAKKEAGDVILQSDDEELKCFYFSLPILSAVSSFFRNLPPPSALDLDYGTPLIPLSDAPSAVLFLALYAIRSMINALPLDHFSLRHCSGFQITPNTFIEAAAFGKRYEMPCIYRILIEAIPCLRLESDIRPFLDFAIWSVTGIEENIAKAGLITLNLDITALPKSITSALRRQSPASWSLLRSAHLRRSHAVTRFRKAIKSMEHDRKERIWKYTSDKTCHQCRKGFKDSAKRVAQALLGASTVQEVIEMRRGDYGLECRGCATTAVNPYREVLQWFELFSGFAEFDESYVDYRDAHKRDYSDDEI